MTADQIKSLRLTTPAATGSTTRSDSRASAAPSAHKLTPYQLDMVDLLEIPMNLTDRPPGSVDLRVAFSKYQAVLRTQATIIWMREDESWKLKKPKAEEVIEIFVSKTVWHDKYRKLFPLAEDYPLLKKWLENGIDAPSNVEVFGKEKNIFTFTDLTEFVGKAEAEKAAEEERRTREDRSKKRKAKGTVSQGKKKNKSKAKDSDSVAE